MKKIFAVFLTLLLTSFAVTAYAVGEAEQTHSHCVCGKINCTDSHLACGKTTCKDHNALEKAGNIQWQAWDGDTSVGTAGDTSAAELYLYLEKDITIPDTLNITNVSVYLCLNGKTLTISKEGHPAVRVGNSQKFVLCDCIGTGKVTGANGSPEKDTTRNGAINCLAGSTFVMYGGSIADNDIKEANGGGIFVNGGTFAMHGGSVNNNMALNGSGGGISAYNSEIYVYAGEITGNKAINSGAIHLAGSTKAYLYNARVNHNTATGCGGAIHMESNSILDLRGAELAYNTAKVSGGAIYSNGAGQLINMVDANIHGNTVTEGSGGGIYIRYGSMNLIGGSISDNHCDSANGNGGGICLISANILRTGGADPNYDNSIVCYINNNTAGGQGGGIYTKSSNNSSHFAFSKKCEIKGNTAKKEGGGMCVHGSYNYLILGETTITENTASQGGGIYLSKENSENSGRELEIKATVTIIGNTLSGSGAANNLYLNNGRMFQFYNSVSGNTRIGVSVSNTPTVSEPTGIVYKGGASYSDGSDRTSLIESDNDDYMVIYKSASEMHFLVPCYTVTVNPNNGDEIQTIKVKCGDVLSSDKLTVPEFDGYYFDGWFADGVRYDFDNPVNGNITLTARWVNPNRTSLDVYPENIVVFNLDRPAVLYVASYNKNKLLDIKALELNKTEKQFITINETDINDGIQINTENATKITAYLWETVNGVTNMMPLCENVSAELHTN